MAFILSAFYPLLTLRTFLSNPFSKGSIKNPRCLHYYCDPGRHFKPIHFSHIDLKVILTLITFIQESVYDMDVHYI